MNGKKVLIVDDEKAIRDVISEFLSDMGLSPIAVETAEEGLVMMEGAEIPVALVDIKLPGMDGLELLGKIKKVSPDTEVVIITSYASLDTAIEAIRKEAYDYLQKPFEDLDEILVTVQRAFEKRELSLKNKNLLGELERHNQQLSAAVTRLTALIEAARAMSGIHSTSELLDYFIEVVVKELDSERASLMLLDKETREMKIVASRGISEEVIQDVRVKLGDGISGWVAQTGRPILVKDVMTDPRIKDRVKPHLSESFISAPITLSIPIIFHEKILGVINVTNRRSGEPFDDDDMAFLYGLAGQVAVAIERGRHFDELQQAYESLKKTRDQLIAMERLKALGQMAAGVAHDFNNILGGILGRAQLLRLQIDEPDVDWENIRSEIEVIERISSQGAETVRRIQEFTGIRKDNPEEEVDINGVVRNATEITRTKWMNESEANGTRIQLRLDLGEIPKTAGNSHELSQAVSNLIFNAVDAMPEGGTLTLGTSLEEDRIKIEVTDTGTGMSEEVKSRIFEPFFTTKETGHGLGLSVIHGIVSRYRGEISVCSEEGNGSTISVRLPVILPKVENVDKKLRKMENSCPANVLIVEDDELNRKLFEKALSVNGHQVMSKPTGKEALSLLEQVDFDLVITDLSMPGMSGWDVAREVKKRKPHVPVILLSGWAIQQEEEKVKTSGVDHVIKKPCSIEELRETVEEFLNSRVETEGGLAVDDEKRKL